MQYLRNKIKKRRILWQKEIVLLRDQEVVQAKEEALQVVEAHHKEEDDLQAEATLKIAEALAAEALQATVEEIAKDILLLQWEMAEHPDHIIQTTSMITTLIQWKATEVHKAEEEALVVAQGVVKHLALMADEALLAEEYLLVQDALQPAVAQVADQAQEEAVVLITMKQAIEGALQAAEAHHKQKDEAPQVAAVENQIEEAHLLTEEGLLVEDALHNRVNIHF